MTILETGFTLLPLEFGNLSIAFLLLSLATLVLYFSLEVIIRLLGFMLATDDENAPDYNIQNPLDKFLHNKNHLLNRVRIVKEETDYYIKGLFLYYDPSTSGWEDSMFRHASFFTDLDSAKEAESSCRAINKFTLYGFVLVLGDLLILDTSIYLLEISFFPTIFILGSIVFVLSVRMLAKRFYSVTKKHEDHLTDHDKDIKDLQSKI